MAGHPLLKGFHLGEQRGGALHQLGVLLRPVGEPERQLVEPDETERFLGDGGSGAMPHGFVGEYAADVVQDEREVDVLEDRAVGAAQDVFQVLALILAYPAHVRVQARLPGAIADPAGELGQVLRVGVELVAVKPLQPVLPADLA